MDGRPKASEIKKYLMWSKINQLKREGHSISRIKKLTGYDRKTIRKYLRMTEEEFMAQGCCVRHYASRLDKYRDFIDSRLENYGFLSNAAIHNQLRLNFPDLEKFNQKTVYNYVQKIRREENIPMESEGNNRPYCMLEQTASADYAQADFGEKWIEACNGVKKKVYFFVLVLSRWCHKFVWFSGKVNPRVQRVEKTIRIAKESWQVYLAIFISVFTLMFFVASVVWQEARIEKCRISDIKYHYIMMHNGVNSAGLDSIESWFRDPNKVKIIESEVRAYEKRVQQPQHTSPV